MSDAAINLGQALLRSESRYGDKAALLVPERSGVFRTVTYREIADLVRGYAEVLDELHLSPGDRVAIQGENSVNWALADWACQTLGLVVVPIYPTLPADQAQY
ncbi:MAG: AMP-binding protein, partial [Nitrospirae bacterium]|nr:AMP-binding protein [Fimbriimonadaceae bacterium]